jgi:hypothetical protein
VVRGKLAAELYLGMRFLGDWERLCVVDFKRLFGFVLLFICLFEITSIQDEDRNREKAGR